MKNSDSKIIIILTNEDNTNIKAQFRTFDILNSVKKKIYSLFFPLPNNIIIKYGNINITKCLDVKLGHLFPNKKQIKLNIISNTKQPTNPLKPIKKLVKNNSTTVINGNNDSKPYIYKYTKLKLPPIQKNMNMIHNISLNNIKVNASTNDISISSTVRRNNLIVPKIKLKTIGNNKEIKIKKNLLGEKKINLKNFNIDVIYNRCVECFYMDVKIYCRFCNKFICKKCFDKTHSIKDHLGLEIDRNERKNFLKYKEELSNNLDNSLKSINYLENVKTDKINIDTWNKTYKEGIDKLVEAVDDIKNKAKIEDKNDSKNKDNNELDLELIKREYKYINGIDCRVYRDPFETFFELNNKEKEIYKIINEYKNNVDKNKNIGDKIYGYFYEIENEIDKIMFELEQQVYESKKNIQINNK